MKIAALVGSNRRESLNKKVVLFMQERYQEQLTIEIIPIENLPMYNQDEERIPPLQVNEMKQMVSHSDGVLIATPEYNHSIPAVLKNALDWFSRPFGKSALANKPTFIIGACPGMLGTVRAQTHLREILNSPGISALTLPGNEVFIGNAHEKINVDGQLIDSSTIEFLDTVVKNFIAWIERVKQ
ncbi:NADPH-dependent FMN reductase [Shimazuella kribbensis]|uniref:NADPH-dependent FMN reductase n=1 Tax=Shimazuella kribbensis TaxID=139808 RepID=UPI00041DA62C|nr:NADPH-dependent FMN reductase [Shimazuella kribbensis]